MNYTYKTFNLTSFLFYVLVSARALVFNSILDWLDYYSISSWIDWIIIQYHLGLVRLLFNIILDWLDYISQHLGLVGLLFDSILD